MRTRFLLLTAIWGASFLFIKLGLEALAPAQLVLARLAIGALVVSVVMAVRGERWPRSPRIWGHMLIAAVLQNTLPFMLIAHAELHLPTTVVAICNATVPLFTVAIAAIALPDERPGLRRLIGLGVGFAGVFVVLGAWHARGPDPRYALLVLAGTACYALGGVHMRKATAGSGLSGLSLTAAQLALGAAQMAVIVPWTTTLPTALPLRVVLAVGTLGALGTSFAYVLQYELLRRAGATVASTVTYCLPIVSIALGVIVLDEPLAWNAPLGAAIIIAGALLSRARAKARVGRLAVAPTAGVVQLKLAPVCASDTKVRSPGKVSVSATSLASAGPLLVTVMV